MNNAGRVSQVPDELWRSLRLFSVYRLLIALLLASVVFYRDILDLGSQNRLLYIQTSRLYLVLAIGFLPLIVRARSRFEVHLSIQILVDLCLLTVMMYASGGQKSGMAALILMVVAGAGLVGQGRLTLFFAAVASVALLIEQGFQTLQMNAESGEFLRTGFVCIGFFAMAITARLLGRRALSNERLAQARGLALDRQLAISNRIIGEMADGVLVLDESGVVRQCNATAVRLLEVQVGISNLQTWSPRLAAFLADSRLRLGGGEDRIQWRERGLRLRLQSATGQVGDDPVVFVEDMERVRQQAQQLKLAALGRLTANIAHEVRNPLASILHAAELLGEDEADMQRRRLASIIASNAERLNQLISEVLELGRRDRAAREALDWAGYARMFLDELSLHEPSAQERVHFEGSSVAILFDRGHLHRVLWNLLANALRYASLRAGAICVRIKTPHAGRVAVEILDDGPGISATVRDQVFEPFVTGHGAGTGLGLYIARELCEANGARLDLLPGASELGGANFRLDLEVANQ